MRQHIPRETTKFKEKIENDGDNELFSTPVFLRATNLKDFISNELIVSSKPFVFQMKGVKKNWS